MSTWTSYPLGGLQTRKLLQLNFQVKCTNNLTKHFLDTWLYLRTVNTHHTGKIGKEQQYIWRSSLLNTWGKHEHAKLFINMSPFNWNIFSTTSWIMWQKLLLTSAVMKLCQPVSCQTANYYQRWWINEGLTQALSIERNGHSSVLLKP